MKTNLKLAGACLVLFAFLAAAPVTPPPVEPLFPITQDDKWGLIDRTGAIVVPPTYQKIGAPSSWRDRPPMGTRTFAGPLIVVELNELWGFIDRTGKVVVTPQYDSVGEFSEGLAAVEVGKQYGYINETGRMVIPPRFDDAREFSEGLAPASEAGLWCFIDRDGKNVTRPKFDEARPFVEGRAYVEVRDLHETKRLQNFPLAGFIDHDGEWAVLPRYSGAHDFSEGLAQAWAFTPNPSGKGWNGPMVFIDLNGKRPFHAGFDEAHDFHQGRAWGKTGDLWGLIDSTGKIVIPPTYGLVQDFSEGLAAILTKNRKYGYVDLTGRLVIPGQFDLAGDFSAGLAPAMTRGQWGYIDPSGQWIIQPQFWAASRFEGGLAAVRTGTTADSKFGYIDSTGTIVWQEIETGLPGSAGAPAVKPFGGHGSI